MNNNKVVIKNNFGKEFSGSEKCARCHKDVYNHFVKTSHFHTSLPATDESIIGNLNYGKNIFSYSHYSKVGMEDRDSGIYQVEYDQNYKEKQAHRFDIIIGSGTRGQSYMSWVDNTLIQLPISFFTAANAWANSPGYSNNHASFSRIITAQCLECHSTYFKALSTGHISKPSFDRNQIIYGVQCESCHGPGAEHVSYHELHTRETKGKRIYNPKTFTRQQQLDLCGFCHGGLRQSDKIAFSFMPGDTLSHSVSPISDKPDEVEVHSNNYGLLAQSKCFKMSNALTCNSCHNTHNQERGNLGIFSARCITCHDSQHEPSCKMTASLGKFITTNCIDCHMPEKESKMLTVKLEDQYKNRASTLRSHLIAIYPDETKKYLSKINVK